MKKKNLGTSALAVLLSLIMLMSGLPVTVMGQTTDVDGLRLGGVQGLAAYSDNDAVIYSAYFYLDENGSVEQSHANGYTLDGTAAVNVFIGDYPDGVTPVTEPKPGDIEVTIGTNLKLNGCITANKVNGGQNILKLVADGHRSEIGCLKVEDGVSLVLTVTNNTVLYLGSLILGAGADIQISLSDNAKLSIGDIDGANGNIALSGEGTLELTGEASVLQFNAEDISVELAAELYVSTAELTGVSLSADTASNISVTAKESISVSGGEVSGVAFLGFGETEVANPQLNINGARFNDVTLGAGESCLKPVTIYGLETAQCQGTYIISDFELNYISTNGAVLYPEANNKYRAKYTPDMNVVEVLGIFGDSGEFSQSTQLKEYSENGYLFTGWSINNSSEVYTNLVSDGTPVFTQAGTLTLCLGVISDSVSVCFDLGFTPDEYSSDLQFPTIIPDDEFFVGDEILLPENPTRMGHVFNGWKVVSGTSNTIINSDATTYTIKFEDLTYPEAEEGAQVTIVAQWLATAQWAVQKYPFRINLANLSFPEDYLRVSFNGGESFIMLEEVNTLLSGLCTYSPSQKTLSFSDIEYGQSLDAYFESKGCSFPVFDDIRTTQDALEASGWQTANGKSVTGSSLFAYGGSALHMLDNKPANQTIAQYSTHLINSPFNIQATWVGKKTGITFSTPSQWTSAWGVYINDVKQVLTNQAPVLDDIPAGTVVEFRVRKDYFNATSANGTYANFSRWSFTGNYGVEVKPFAVEEEMTVGSITYCIYRFIMPAVDVYASFFAGTEININLKESPFTDQILTLAGRTHHGFWTNQEVEGLMPLIDKSENGYGYGEGLSGAEEYNGIGYCNNVPQELVRYYEWPINTRVQIRFTTEDDNLDYGTIEEGNGTWNQIKVLNRYIVLEDCHLWPTTHYTQFANSDYASLATSTPERLGYDLGLNRGDEIPYFGNICQLTSSLAVYISGNNNIVGGFVASSTSYNYANSETLSIIGETNDQTRQEFRVGSFCARYTNTSLTDIELYPIGEESHYADNYRVLVNATGNNGGTFGLTRSSAHFPEKSVSAGVNMGTGCGIVQVRSISRGFSVASGLLSVEKNVGGYSNSVTGAGSVIIKGNIARGGSHNLTANTINTTGIVAVFGNYKADKINLQSGTLITNSLSVGCLNQTGGRYIGNFIANWLDYDSNSSHAASSNGDNALLQTYAVKDAWGNNWGESLNFSGGDTYLLGHYKLNTNGKMDTAETIAGEENPLKSLVQVVNGLTELTAEEATQTVNAFVDGTILSENGAYDEAKVNNSEHECVIYGDSTYTGLYSTSVNGGVLHAAGRLDFFNDVSISSGRVECTALTSKQDIAISGGEVYAKDVGNICSVATGPVNHFAYAKLTVNDNAQLFGVENLGRATPPSYLSGYASRSYAENIDFSCIDFADSVNGLTVYRDIYVNYYDDIARRSAYNGMSATNRAKINVIIENNDMYGITTTAEWDGEADFSELIFTSGTESFPHMTPRIQEDGEYIWCLSQKDLSKAVTGYDQMKVVKNGLEVSSLESKDNILLYAVIYKIRELTFYHDGMVTGITADGIEQPLPTSTEFTAISLEPGALVTVTLSEPMTDKTVFWYKNVKDKYINLYDEELTFSEDGLTVSFIMQNLDRAELYICNEIPLFLDKYNINLSNGHINIANSDTVVYTGDVRISDSRATADAVITDTGSTYTFTGIASPQHQLAFAANYNDPRTVTLHRVVINAVGATSLVLNDNAKVELTIDGNIAIGYVVGYGASQIKFKGKKEFTGLDNITDRVALVSPWFQPMRVTMTNISFENVELDCGGQNIYHSTEGPTSTSFMNTVVNGYCSNVFVNARSNPNTFENCRVNLKFSSATASLYGWYCDMTLKNTTFTSNARYFQSPDDARTVGGRYVSTQSNVSLDNSTLILGNFEDENATQKGTWVRNLTMTNGSTFKSAYGIITAREGNGVISLDDGSRLICGNDVGTGDVYSPNIIVKGESEIVADRIFVAGYAQSNGSTDLSKPVNGLTNNNNGLIVEDSIINATTSIGGDLNSEITLTNSTVNTNILGTTGSYYAWTRDDECIPYSLVSGMVNKSIITATNSTINLTENGYIGGGESTITLTSCTVNAPQGDINGKAITVSGEQTAIELRNMVAENGNVTIKNASGAFNISDLTHFPSPPQAGVLINGQLKAREIDISEQATVFAAATRVWTPEGTNGYLKITSEDSDTRLYTNAFGVMGSGSSESSDYNEFEPNRNLFYKDKIISIEYFLNDGEMLPDGTYVYAYNASPVEYIQNSLWENDYVLELIEPERYSFDFNGWFASPDFSGEPITQLDTRDDTPVVLYAKWSPKMIAFKLFFDYSDETISAVASLNDLLESELGTFNSETGIFTYNNSFAVPAHGKIVGAGGKNLEELNLESYKVMSFMLEDERYGGSNPLVDINRYLTDDIINAYGDGASPLMLRVTVLQKTRGKLSFHLKENASDKPLDAEFIGGNGCAISTDISRASYLDFGVQIGNGLGFTEGGEFISAYAPGYAFGGWFTPSGTEITASKVAAFELGEDFYAKWTPLTYTVKFDAGNVDEGQNAPVLTEDGSLPTESAPTELTYSIVYDTPITTVPRAWKQGYKFDHWEVNGVTLNQNDILTREKFTEIIIANGELEGNGEVALTFTPVYTPVTVTYNINGGKWRNPAGLEVALGSSVSLSATPAYGSALAGATAISESEDYIGSLEVVSQNFDGKHYAVLSTSGEYFNLNGDYFDSENPTLDYRRSLYKYGYTFEGWYTANNGHASLVLTVPMYEDITLWARWTENCYTLNLNACEEDAYYADRETENDKYYFTEFYNDYLGVEGRVAPTANVQVNHMISASGGANVNVENWPERGLDNSWCVYDSLLNYGDIEESQKRKIIGFTFGALDPASSDASRGQAAIDKYSSYATTTTALISRKLLFMKDLSRFTLPEYYGYAGLEIIPDYPNGSTIDMYAVYRERSLVFMESFIDRNGELQLSEVSANPYEDYSNYPDIYIPNPDSPYDLMGWYFHESVPNPSLEYPETAEEYTAMLPGLLSTVNSNKVYDIKVYTVYAVTYKEENASITTSSNPAEKCFVSQEFVVPNNIITGDACFNGVTLSSDEIGLCDITNIPMVANESSEHAVLTVEFESPDGTTLIEKSLGDAGNLSGIGAGWKIRFKLYPSRQIPEAMTITTDVVFKYTGELDSQQFIVFDTLTLNYVPTEYEITVEGDEGVEVATGNGTYTYNQEVTLDYTVKADYHALGWFDSANNKVSDTTEFVFNCTESATYYAKTATHNFVLHPAKAPTCLEVGWEEYITCTGCDYSTYVELDALGHDYHVTSVDEPTCTDTGTKHLVCSRDASHTLDEEIPALDHTWNTNIVLPTCLEQGYTEYHCANDSAHDYIADYTDALGHDWELDYTDAATCTEGGTNYYVCRRDSSHKYTESIPSHGHDYQLHHTDEPTCTQGGTKHFVCTYDASHFYDEPIAPLGHIWGEWIVIVEPTVDAEGVEARYCQRCNAEERRAIPKLEKPQEKTRWLKFVSIDRMDYVVDNFGIDYTIFTTREIEVLAAYDVNFRVHLYSNFGYCGVTVYANNVVLPPNEDGTYTIPAGENYVIITCVPAEADDDNDGDAKSIIDKIKEFFERIIAIISGWFSSGKSNSTSNSNSNSGSNSASNSGSNSASNS